MFLRWSILSLLVWLYLLSLVLTFVFLLRLQFDVSGIVYFELSSGHTLSRLDLNSCIFTFLYPFWLLQFKSDAFCSEECTCCIPNETNGAGFGRPPN